MLYKVVQMFESADDVVFKIVGISIKAIEQKALFSCAVYYALQTGSNVQGCAHFIVLPFK